MIPAFAGISPNRFNSKITICVRKIHSSSSIIYILLQNAQPWTYWKHNLLNANIQQKNLPVFHVAYTLDIIFRQITMFF